MNKIQKVSTEVQSFIAYLAILVAFGYFGYSYSKGDMIVTVLSVIAGCVAVSRISRVK